MAEDRHVEKIEKSPYFGNGLTDYHEILTVKILNLKKSKTADGCRLEIRKKIAICFDRLPRNLARLRIMTFRTLQPLRFYLFKIQDVRQHNFKY